MHVEASSEPPEVRLTLSPSEAYLLKVTLERACYMDTPPEDQDQDAIDAAVAALAEEQNRVEKRVAARGADYILGADICRADLTWLAAVEIGERGGLMLDPARYPWLAAWRARLAERPSYKATYPAHWK